MLISEYNGAVYVGNMYNCTAIKLNDFFFFIDFHLIIVYADR